jgi:Ca2+-binding EF-hand superfamily protein
MCQALPTTITTMIMAMAVQALAQTGVDEREVQRVIQEADRDRDGSISFMEFVVMMRNL